MSDSINFNDNEKTDQSTKLMDNSIQKDINSTQELIIDIPLETKSKKLKNNSNTTGKKINNFDLSKNPLLKEKLQKLFISRDNNKFTNNKLGNQDCQSSQNDENISPNIPNKVDNINKFMTQKKFNNFSKTIIENYIRESNKKEKTEVKQENDTIKDIIEKLKENKIDKKNLYDKEIINKKEPPKNRRKSLDLKTDNIIFPPDKENVYFTKKNENISPKIKKSKTKYSNISQEKDNRKKKIGLKIEINKDTIENKIKKNMIPRPIRTTKHSAYKKPINQLTNSRQPNIYRPKRPSITRERMSEKSKPILQLQKLTNISNSSTNIFSTMQNNSSFFDNEGKIPYSKKSSQKKLLKFNYSFCGDIKNDKNAIGRNKINELKVNKISNLNSSFDSYGVCNFDTMTNGTNNDMMKRLNNSFYYVGNYNNNSNLFTNRSNNNNILFNFNLKNTNAFARNSHNNPELINNKFYGMTNNDNYHNDKVNNYLSINIEDLLILEEKFIEIILTLNKNEIIYNECFEFWNYYFNCSFYCRLEKLFTNIYEINSIKMSINFLLMTIIICYDISFNLTSLRNANPLLNEILKLNHQNLIIMFEYILSKIKSENNYNIWVSKLKAIVHSTKNTIYNKEFSAINENSMTPPGKISYNTGIISQSIKVLIHNYAFPNVEKINNFFLKLNKYSYDDINIFFRENILRVPNINGSVLASIFLKENNNFKTEPAPYLKTINRKPYSLILDLDETLVNFKVNPKNDNEGVLRVRPGVINFLDQIDKYYELIIFTAATQEYADLLIDAVEDDKIYFEHRLYRQHTVIIGNDFVKDLSRIGRPLDKIAIVDNMPQNFRLQKENGIIIKAFWGDEYYDTALIDLAPILINIAKDGGDIRKGIAKYKNEIVRKVSSNISKHIK